MPEFCTILARKMSEFYMIIARKIFFPNCRGVPPAPRLLRVWFAVGARSYFMIVSRMNGLVLDVEKWNKKPGAWVITYRKKP